MTESILERVRQIVSDTFNVPLETVSTKSSPETIEAWDSIAHLNLVLALESSFAISFLPEEIAEITSVQSIYSKLDAKLSQK